MAAIQDMMAIPFNLCKTPSEHEQQMLQSTANGPQRPGNVASRAGPGPDGSQPNGGGGGEPRARAGPGPGGRHPSSGGGGWGGDPRRSAAAAGRGGQASSVGEAADSDWQRPTVDQGKEVAPDSQKPAESFAYAAGLSAEPTPTPAAAPPPPRRPGQQSVSATLGYLVTTPVASFQPDPRLEAAGSNVRSQEDVPGRLPAWPGPSRRWLESRVSDELPPRDHEDAAGPVATKGGRPRMC